jgi:hypothetical protein
MKSGWKNYRMNTTPSSWMQRSIVHIEFYSAIFQRETENATTISCSRALKGKEVHSSKFYIN